MGGSFALISFKVCSTDDCLSVGSEELDQLLNDTICCFCSEHRQCIFLLRAFESQRVYQLIFTVAEQVAHEPRYEKYPRVYKIVTVPRFSILKHL